MHLRPRLRWLWIVVWLAVTLGPARPPAVLAEEPAIAGVGGLVPSEGDFPRLAEADAQLSADALPARVDLSANLPPVGSQGMQNSCVGWALAYYYRSFLQARDGGWVPTSAAQQFSPAWVYNQRPTDDCAADGGMSYYSGFRILQDLGAATLAQMPYSAADHCTLPSSAATAAAADYRVASFANVFSGVGQANLDTLKGLLARGEPFAIAAPLYESFYCVTSENPVVPRHAAGETNYGGHALFVVGYDDAIGGFKAVNSWGRGWGQAGYAYLSYDFVRFDCFEAWVMTAATLEPAVFTGSIVLGAVASLQGSPVTAWIGTSQVAAGTVTVDDTGPRYSLVVPADDPLTAAVEGGVEGDVVRFRVGGVPAASGAVWRSAQTVTRDLTLNPYRCLLVFVASG